MTEDPTSRIATTFVDVDGVTVDLGRQIRTGAPEVVYGESKDEGQIETLALVHKERALPLLVSRVKPGHADILASILPEGRWHPRSRVFVWNTEQPSRQGDADPALVVVSAGASDAAVVEEISLVVSFIRGSPPVTLADCGVAGIHRLLAHLPRLRKAHVIVAVAGMDGVLPTAVAGLVRAPVIGVPTSVGYGAGAGGYAPLLTMLSSCAPGLMVVNIDNGVGAAFAAVRILSVAPRGSGSSDIDTRRAKADDQGG